MRFSILLLWIISSMVLVAQPENSRLIWSDEFETDGSPDAAKWDYDLGGSGWGNNELQFYTNRPENVKVEGGYLIITAIKESYVGMQYTSARITSRQKGDWLYGRIEVMAMLPEGRGTWPAIWMLPTDWAYGGWPASGEFDIMEHVGYDMGNVHATIHTQAYNGAAGTQRGNHLYLADAHTAFHLYAAEWTEDTLKFYADDSLYFTYTNDHTSYATWPYNKRFHLMMNIAVGGNWGGVQGVDNTIFPQDMQIDFVRVYEVFHKSPVSGPTQVYDGQENLTYSITDFEGADYTWNFPAGVTIKSGQGTASVNVDWGEEAGMVSVLQEYNETSYLSEIDVSLITLPGDGPINIKSNENTIGSWSIEAGEGNEIRMDYEN